MVNTLQKIWRDNKGFVTFLCLMLVFRSAIADWNDVPSGSMEPTIQVGDRMLVNKLAYDIQIPFTNKSLIKLDDPNRGDIAIFESKVSGKRLVKRIIGIPGDEIAMTNNVLIVNGQALNYSSTPATAHKQSSEAIIQVEALFGLEYTIKIHSRGGRFANFPAVKVPEDQYLVLGDNRDNSADYRAIGFVPRDEIIGRSSRIALSLDYENNFLPRFERFFQAL